MELWNKKHSVRSAFIVLFLMLLPAAGGYWSLFSNEPMFPTIAKWMGAVNMPDISIIWLSVVTVPFGVIMLFLIYRETKKTKSEPKEKIAEDFKIKLEKNYSLTTGFECVGNYNIPEKPLLKMNITFIPNQSMQFAKLHLKIDNEEENEPIGEPMYKSFLKLPYLIERPETHVVCFEIPLRYATKAKRKAQIIALVGGYKWESKQFDLEFLELFTSMQ